MPPWLPQPQELKFADQMRLSDAEIKLIHRWVEQGEMEGSASDLPPPPKYVEGWMLGKPDLVLTATKPLTLRPQGTDTYWNFIFPVPTSETKWVKAVEIRPGDKQYVHHANILVDREEASRSREDTPGAGFGGWNSYRLGLIRPRESSLFLEAGVGATLLNLREWRCVWIRELTLF